MKHNFRQHAINELGLPTVKHTTIYGELGSKVFDKNGIEIFEGDAVKALTPNGDEEVGEVVFDTGTFMWEASSGWATELDSGGIYELEVIGHADDKNYSTN